jgi:hypothetical protein
MVVPLTVVQLMFCTADVSRCVYTSGSVAVRLSDSPRLAQKTIYFVQGDKVKPMFFSDASSEWAQFKTFELGLNYRRTMERVQLNVIPKAGSTVEEWHKQIRSYLSMWWTFLKTHKQRQLTIEDHTQWPDNLPWPVNNVWDMPVMIWLAKSAA